MNSSDFKRDIPELRGYNYKVWKERVLLHLGWMNNDYAIRKTNRIPLPKPTLHKLSVFMKNGRGAIASL